MRGDGLEAESRAGLTTGASAFSTKYMGSNGRCWPAVWHAECSYRGKGLCVGGWVGTWRLRGLGMVQRIAAVGVVTFVLACGAVCQNVDSSLPDAPSVLAASRAPEF